MSASSPSIHLPSAAVWVGLCFTLGSKPDLIPRCYDDLVGLGGGTLCVVLLTFVLTLYMVLVLVDNVIGTNPVSNTIKLVMTMLSQEKRRDIQVEDFIDEYNNLHKDDLKSRESGYKTLVNAYYELATQFYEWGWGQSFHFASQLPSESFHQAIKRHEYYLAGRLNVSQGAKVLDCGCGIGGPMRNIAQFTGAHVTGITLNQYQVQRCETLNKNSGLSKVCKAVQGDFMKLPFKDGEFDAVYAIEATCHAPCRKDCYSEIFRVLKPGGVFACYEWCLTDKHNRSDDHHVLLKKQIEEGDGLPDIISCGGVDDAIKESGFQIVESADLALDTLVEKPWYTPLTPSWNILTQRFQFTGVGMWIVKKALRVMEACWLAPSGTVKVQAMLQQGALGLAGAGQLGTFTPMYLVVAKKPTK